jgi:hypothetical protein
MVLMCASDLLVHQCSPTGGRHYSFQGLVDVGTAAGVRGHSVAVDTNHRK